MKIVEEMKIELDFENKVITLKDNCSIGDLVEKLKEIKLDDWKSWKIQAGGIEYRYYPYYPWSVYQAPIVPYVQPITPLNPTWTICDYNTGVTSDTVMLNQLGVYTS